MKETFGHATEKDILALEQKYSLKLPEDYKCYLRSCNGGMYDLEIDIPLENANDTTWAERMYGINTGHDDCEIEENTDEYEEDIPPKSIFIGDSSDNCLFTLVTEGEDAGVLCWDHCRMFEHSSDEENCYFLTKTFAEFAEKYLDWKPS